MTSIILVDDHHLVRKALKILLQAEADFSVIGEASDGMEAVELVEKKKPDILLLDLSIPRVHGLDVIRRVCQHGKTKVIVVSMHSADTYVIEAMKNGASGYVLKQSTPADLIKAVRQVRAGRNYFSSSLPVQHIRDSLRKTDDESEAVKGSSALTRREKIVLQLAAEGNNNTQIAKLLYLSPRTVESHRASLMRKLKLRSQTEIVLFAVRKNIIAT